MKTTGSAWLEMKTCAVCGKRFAVLYPNLWRYKRANYYLCSWSCVRRFDREGVENMGERRDRIEIAKTIIEMGKNGQGGAPVTHYLEGLGYKNPVQAVADIKKYIREKAPELYAQWPMRYRGKTTTMGELEKKEEKPAEEKKDAEPERKRFTVTGIRTGLAEFKHDWKHGTVDMRTAEGQELVLLPKEWKQLAEDIPLMLKWLGVIP